MHDDATVTISIILDGVDHLPAEMLQALYRINGRSTVEMRLAVACGDPLYSAQLFGIAHIDAVPRLEKTIAHLQTSGIPFRLFETVDEEHEELTLAALREILGDA